MRKVTETFQNQTDRRFILTSEDVYIGILDLVKNSRDQGEEGSQFRHHLDEMREFCVEVDKYNYRGMGGSKEKMADEFWDCIFSMALAAHIDEVALSDEELLEGLERTMKKIEHRMKSNHYGGVN